MAVLALLVFLQVPAIGTAVNQDRQNYREAIRYVEGEMGDATEELVFSIGYAGEHFRYYASDATTVVLPETFDELSSLMQGKDRLWCLITAWLPAIRPPYEDRALYAETPEQTDLYNYVKEHFVLRKTFYLYLPGRGVSAGKIKQWRLLFPDHLTIDIPIACCSSFSG